MSKVSSKYQITIPKRLAEEQGIVPGTELLMESAGDGLRLSRDFSGEREIEREQALASFDAATQRQEARRGAAGKRRKQYESRGWTREDLYEGRTGHR